MAIRATVSDAFVKFGEVKNVENQDKGLQLVSLW